MGGVGFWSQVAVIHVFRLSIPPLLAVDVDDAGLPVNSRAGVLLSVVQPSLPVSEEPITSSVRFPHAFSCNGELRNPARLAEIGRWFESCFPSKFNPVFGLFRCLCLGLSLGPRDVPVRRWNAAAVLGRVNRADFALPLACFGSASLFAFFLFIKHLFYLG